jgi:hypothetical protein
MERNCEELLENITRTLHECRDNQITVDVREAFDMRDCKNVATWRRNIKDSIPLKVLVKNPILVNKYCIDYKVRERALIISPTIQVSGEN